eukprot:363734-Amphidinium_carterae.1
MVALTTAKGAKQPTSEHQHKDTHLSVGVDFEEEAGRERLERSFVSRGGQGKQGEPGVQEAGMPQHHGRIATRSHSRIQDRSTGDSHL